MSKIKTKIIKKKKLNTADNLEKQISGQFRCTKDRTTSVPLLYRLVYSSRASFITVFILLLSFIFQGTSLTYADEIVESDTVLGSSGSGLNESEITEEFEIQEGGSEAVEEDSVDVNEVLEPQKVVSDVAMVEEGRALEVLTEGQILARAVDVATSDTSPPPDNPPISEDQSSGIETESESLSTNDDFADIDIGAGSTTTSTTTLGDEPDTSEETEPIPEEESPPDSSDEEQGSSDTVTTDTEDDLNSVASSKATSTDELIEEAITITKSDTEYTFNRNECTTLASGSFYCLKADTQVLEDALFSAPDIDGDLEIYLVRNGIQSQITNNQVDDAAPYYDQNSDTIVWHRLIDDRYQIIDYDISSGIETQLTFGQTNSMEPTRQGKYTVWQNWSNNNWNVVLFDGKEQRTITESSAHDIAPYVHGSLVVWNRYSTGQDKTIEMYDMISETYVTVDDPEGLSVTNPRMVFVYDSLHPNGDVVTKGYDMISRKFIQLDTLPRQLPDEIPQSESTGETRALIQSKPSVKSGEVVQNNNATSTGPTPPVLNPATTSDEMTLDLTTATSSPADVLPVLDVPVMAEYELIIPPLELPTKTVQE